MAVRLKSAIRLQFFNAASCCPTPGRHTVRTHGSRNHLRVVVATEFFAFHQSIARMFVQRLQSEEQRVVGLGAMHRKSASGALTFSVAMRSPSNGSPLRM